MRPESGAMTKVKNQDVGSASFGAREPGQHTMERFLRKAPASSSAGAASSGVQSQQPVGKDMVGDGAELPEAGATQSEAVSAEPPRFTEQVLAMTEQLGLPEEAESVTVGGFVLPMALAFLSPFGALDAIGGRQCKDRSGSSTATRSPRPTPVPNPTIRSDMVAFWQWPIA